MFITVEMACSVNGLIATEDGNEDFLSNRNYQIMLDFLKDYDCLVWGNTTFKNVVSWGDNYINDLKEISVIVFSKEENQSIYNNVIYCNSLEHFRDICKEKELKKIFVSGGARINTLFLKNNLVNNIIINYNPFALNKGINLFEGDYFQKELELDKVVKEQNDIVQVWYNIKKEK
jgi:dihydrofolate reductase